MKRTINMLFEKPKSCSSGGSKTCCLRETTSASETCGDTNKEAEKPVNDASTIPNLHDLQQFKRADEGHGNESHGKTLEAVSLLLKAGIFGDVTPARGLREQYVYVLDRMTLNRFPATGRLLQTLQTINYQTEVFSPFYSSELNRLASFATWQRERRPSAQMMSSAGFFFTLREDEVSCFSCGLTLRGWTEEMHPLSAHRALSRGLCKFLKNPAESGNVPMGNFNTTKSSDGLSEDAVLGQAAPASHTVTSSSASDFRTGPSCQLSSGKSGAICFGGKKSIPFSHLQSLLPDGVNLLRTALSSSAHVTGSKEQPHHRDDSVKHETFRLSTFKNSWSYAHIVSATDLARNGLFYTGVSDRVQCAFCQGTLRNWEQGDVVAEQHAQHFTYCRFVQGHDVGNFPIPFTPLLPETTETVNHVADGGASLGISRASPKHPDLAAEARRMSTFATWPNFATIKPETLVKAGFFYTGLYDEVKCFYCDGTKMDWEQHSDAWIEHARRFPTCQYVIQVKGSEFVTQHNTAHSGNIRSAEKKAFAVDQREIRARIDSPKVRILLQMDYPLDLIREALQKRLAAVGRDHETVEDILADVFAVHDEKQTSTQRNSVSASARINEAQPVVINEPIGPAVPDALSSDSKRQRDSVRDTMARGIFGEQAASSILPSVIMVPSGRKISPKDENQQLKTQLICKICMDAVVGIVFLPCGHFVACAECAPALSKCPICRVDIRGTVRSIL